MNIPKNLSVVAKYFSILWVETSGQLAHQPSRSLCATGQQIQVPCFNIQQ
jgi:hypothetical protein